MATLEKIRNKAGLLVVVIGVALFAFIIGDFLNSSHSFFAMKQGDMLTINDEKINIEEFNQFAEELRSSGMISDDEFIYEAAYDSIINKYVLDQEFEMLGITVTDKELQDLLVGENIHSSIKGQQGFNMEQYVEYIKMLQNPEAYGITDPYQIEAMRANWMLTEMGLRRYRESEKMMNLLNAAVAPNKLDIEMAYQERSVASDIRFVKLPYTTVANTLVEVTEDEINSRYDAIENKEFVEESRLLKYIQVDLRPSAADYAAVKAQIDSCYNGFVKTTDVRNFVNANSHSEYVSKYTSVEKLDASLRAFVDTAVVGDVTLPQSIGEQYVMYRYMGGKVAPDTIKTNIVAFAPGDTTINTVFAQLQGGVSLDSIKTIYEGSQSVAVIEDYAVLEENINNYGALFINDVYGAGDEYFKTTMLDGTQCVVKVVERTADVKKVDVATFALDVVASDQTIHDTEAKLQEYVAANSNIEDFVNNAVGAGYVVRNGGCRINTSKLANISGTRDIVRWANNSSEGAVSEVYEVGTNCLVVAAVEEIIPRGVAPLSDQDKMQIERQIINEKKAEMLKDKLAAVKYTTLDELATAMDVTVETRSKVAVGDRISNMAVAGAVSRLQEGAISEPIVANDGVYVVEVVSKMQSGEPYNEELMKANVYRPVSYDEILESLRQNSAVKTTYTKFY